MVDNIKIEYVTSASYTFVSAPSKGNLARLDNTCSIPIEPEQPHYPTVKLNHTEEVDVQNYDPLQPRPLKRHKCPHCDTAFRRNDHLKRHIKSLHSGGPALHYCPSCDKSFKRRDHMMRHMDMKHTPESVRFRCADCNEEFGKLEELLAHEQALHGVAATPRLPCPHCEVTFKRRDHMLRHVKTKHLHQVINCPLCPSVYKRKDHLVRHLREKHKTGLTYGAVEQCKSQLTS